MKWERTFPNATRSVVRARRFATETLTGIDPELVDSLTVMLSELVTNSVRHAASEFTVSIDLGEHSVRVGVTDLGERRPRLRNPDPTEPSGRGLQIVNALCDDWGVTDAAAGSGKTVWFALALRPHDHGMEAGGSTEQRAPATRPDVASDGSPRTAGPTRSRGASNRRQESRRRRGAPSRV